MWYKIDNNASSIDHSSQRGSVFRERPSLSESENVRQNVSRKRLKVKGIILAITHKFQKNLKRKISFQDWERDRRSGSNTGACRAIWKLEWRWQAWSGNPLLPMVVINMREDGHSKINHDDARAFVGRKMRVLSRSLKPPSAPHFFLKYFFHYFHFFFFFFWTCWKAFRIWGSMHNLSSLTRDRTYAPYIGRTEP